MVALVVLRDQPMPNQNPGGLGYENDEGKGEVTKGVDTFK
jgi:hypothetical protein